MKKFFGILTSVQIFIIIMYSLMNGIKVNFGLILMVWGMNILIERFSLSEYFDNHKK